ncbi:WD40 domain-containing protein [Metarhizium album ARSEF 1941]|uniref:WD40 domain-containing protein n=1 Tax=Metarhizium album (strain ARSEF 1941) TaxID=1081103 RepID=A0A0B2WQ70_METAS|nr:WD40 domain-containing protein [Metarhizium album ARSEF 1941]KHN95145.1 WD40 domain-containing protein [Metarhizium album ARSEF 1941]
MQVAAPCSMHHTRPFESSPLCKPSPNGRLVAVLSSSTVILRSTETLQTIHAVKLAPELTGSISNLVWAPSSSKVLVSVGDYIQVFAACDSSFQAIIRSPAAPAGGKLSMIQFGSRDTEVLACAPFGIKFSIFDIITSKVVEISNPKFHHPASASRGFSLRPDTGHLLMLTRITRSWYPDTLDAQGVAWTPDGQWIVLWESPAQGSRLLVYTGDGQPFRILDATALRPDPTTDPESDMQPGIKSCQLSSNAELCAAGDHGRGITLLQVGKWRSVMRLTHPTVIAPRETLQVWQEQVSVGAEGRNIHSFSRATQTISPPTFVDSTTTTTTAKQSTDVRCGCSSISFDASSTLLATRLDDSPCTLWIWDLAAAELRAALIFHSPVIFHWHPSARETLLISSHDDKESCMSYVWDPLSQGPTPLHAEQYLPASNSSSKMQVTWLNYETEPLGLLLSNSQSYVLLSLADAEHEPSPWEAAAGGVELDGPSLAPSSGRDEAESLGSARPIVLADDISDLDDTFSFRHT